MWKKRLKLLWPVGVAPGTIALSIAVALVIGVFPVYGCPTLMCAAAAVLLRLNLPAMQAVNFLTSPLQLALWVPFGKLGGHLVHLPDPAVLHSAGERLAARAGAAMVHAVAGWTCVAVPLGLLLYLSLRPLTLRLLHRFTERTRAQTA